MKSRCLNPNTANYKYYGGRGINVCDEWMEFAPFAEWAKEHGYSDNLTIDRKDIDKGYCPDNCEWVTMKHQNNHHKSNIYQIEIDGEKYSLRDFVDLIGESYSKIQTQLNRGKITVESLEQKYCGGLTLNEYQKKAMETCMPSCENFSYMMLNLVGEVGEFASKVAKMIRKGSVEIDTMDDKTSDLFPMVSLPQWVYMQDELKKEAGDILWQLSGLCHIMGWNLEDVAQMNLDKLASRRERGVIDGEGDNR
jgi:NTP pyrophosphatase (non-canonical NTP hydrolase)